MNQKQAIKKARKLGYRYVAMNENNIWYGYIEKPILNNTYTKWFPIYFISLGKLSWYNKKVLWNESLKKV